MSTLTHSFKSGAILIVSLLFFATSAIAGEPRLRSGAWQGFLQLNDSTQLPIRFDVTEENNQPFITIKNAEERIIVKEIRYSHDTAIISMPVFDSEFRVKITDGTSMQGHWINHSRKDKNIIPFSASYCASGCEAKEVFASNAYFGMKGKWECDFSPGTANAVKALAVIDQEDPYKYLSGTFLTETGDYRYLEGRRENGHSFYLACFDGAHAFLFTGKVKGDSIVSGHFYSGAHWHETWVGKRNEQFRLRDPDSLTYMKPGFSKIAFSFPNLEGRTISLSDERYKGKVVIVQLMGSWCPNCMDETQFLSGFYRQYQGKGLEVIALAFERTSDPLKAVANVKRSREKFNAGYEFLITGKTGKDQASEALPMLNKVMAFPTTIYIDKKGLVRKIYTGFNGPATGDTYAKFLEETTLFTEKLLAE